MRCSNCDKAMRPKRAKAADHPGTVREQARGICSTCWKRGVDNPPPPKRGGHTHCVRCRAELRKWNETVKDRPGTRANTGNGVCDACYKKQRAEEAKAGVDPAGTEPEITVDAYPERRPGVAENRASLETWLNTYYRPRVRARAAA